MSKILRVEINDGLLLTGFIARADYTCVLYLRVPDGWVDGEALLPSAKEAVFEKLYGATWREGNEDGSRYVVLNSTERVLDEQAIAAQVWLQDDSEDRKFQYWYYHVTDNGEFQNLKQAQFNQ